MSGLARVLQAKIAITVLAWRGPLLTFPSDLFVQLGFPPPEPEGFVRLLGMAYLALTLGYWFGLQELRNGTYPAATVRVGIVSNGGGAQS